MSRKVLNTLLLLFSLFGYLEWGRDQHQFLFQAEAEVIVKLFTDPGSVLHPFILVPLAGHLLLFITLFQKEPSKGFTYFGIGCVGLLLGFMFVIGVISLNDK